MTLEQTIQEAIKGEILLFKTSEGGSKEVSDGRTISTIVRKLLS